MSRIKSRNTKPELILRRYLHKSGFRYRVNYPLFGKPDLVFPKKKIAIFVHGCFWHQHGCKNSVIPKTNNAFWKEKLNKNVSRDKKVAKELKGKQWICKTIWECEIEDKLQNTTTMLV
ncbi:very short patch repair endonuclease, partial [Patescibacteria group bacterium]|nr:very short patch repair endonuclease [Patescibacteria group bacterium]